MSKNTNDGGPLAPLFKEGKPAIYDLCKRLAIKTEGFSGRGIQKIVVAFRNSVATGRIEESRLNTKSAESLLEYLISTCRHDFGQLRRMR